MSTGCGKVYDRNRVLVSFEISGRVTGRRAHALQLKDMSWQQTNIQAAASYLRESIAKGTTDARAKAVYEGLLEVLDPPRRSVRLQREGAAAVKAAATVKAARERRLAAERRARERRSVDGGSPAGGERRRGSDRRTGRDRRDRS
jgi:hypothetical protein